MAQFQVQPHKQFPTQLKSMQNDIRQLKQQTAKSSTMLWTDIDGSLISGWASISSQALVLEIEPGGNFAYLSGQLRVPSSGLINPMQIGSFGNATECAPASRTEMFPAVQIDGSGNAACIGILVDISGAIWTYGVLTASATLYIDGRYPLNAP